MTPEGVHFLVEDKAVAYAWEDLDPVSRMYLEAKRLENSPPETPRPHFALAMACRREGLTAYGRRQILAIRNGWPDLAPAVDIWLGAFPENASAMALASGLDAFFARRDQDAYRAWMEALKGSNDPDTTRTAKRLLAVLIQAGFRVPEPKEKGPLDRRLQLRRRDIQGHLVKAKQDRDLAARRLREGNVTRMKNALQAAIDTLDRGWKKCDALLRQDLAPEARDVFVNLKKHLKTETLAVYLTTAEYSLREKLWSDAERAIFHALSLDPDNPRALAFKKELEKSRLR